MKRLKRVAPFVLTAMLILLVAGCAGSKNVMRTEEGYAPTHLVVGEIIAYTQGQGMIKQQEMERLILQHLEEGLRNENVRHVRVRDRENSGVAPEQLGQIDVEVTFLPTSGGMENSYDARFTYTVKRLSDGAMFDDGSAKSTDLSVSTGGTLDLDNAIRFAAQATVRKIKGRM